MLDEAGQAGLRINQTLKRHGDIILVPQPSDDPDDPLVSRTRKPSYPFSTLSTRLIQIQNWPRRKRDTILLILCLISLIASTLSPLLAANTVALSLHYGVNFTQSARLTAYHLLGVGVAGFIFVASARVWGKRHLYLLGTLLIIVSSAWGGASAGSFNSLLAARVVQGIGLAPFEALVNASVGDLYFVHVSRNQA